MQNFKIRSMFMFSSIATALKQGADRSRFAQLTLKNPEVEFATAEERAAHWDAIRKALDTYISVDVGRRLQARTFSLIPVIRDSIEVYKKAASEFFGATSAMATSTGPDVPVHGVSIDLTTHQRRGLCVDGQRCGLGIAPIQKGHIRSPDVRRHHHAAPNQD